LIALDAACQVFCEGFSLTRSFTHPYLVSREGKLLIMHDGPRRRANDYRRAEFVSPNLPVDEVLAAIEHLRRDSDSLRRYALCAVTPGNTVCEATKDAYKSRGYRLFVTEPMMVADVSKAPALNSHAAISRVKDQTNADRVSAAAGGKQILPRHLADDPPILRLYMAEVDGEPVGWVRSIHRSPDLSWVSNMFVKPEFRRQGIAKALLSAMLQDDERHGVKHSILLASHTGAMVYPALGYEQIGMLHAFSPVQK
jgi:GNAT superfamily N-acetyltransferase